MTKRHQYMQALLDMVASAKGHAELPWRKPTARPTNAASGRPYRGVNRVNLMVSQLSQGFGEGHWMTFRQAQKAGGAVRKGERGTKIIFYKRLEEDERKEGRPDFLLRTASVFNIEQIDGVDTPDADTRPRTQGAYEAARAFCSNIPVALEHRAGRAFYSPAHDRIVMPPEADFRDTGSATASQHYLSVLLHELAHATGHKSRLDRFPAERTKETTAYEELIAESTAALLSLELGIEATLIPDHAQYLSSWQSVIAEDPGVLVRAMSAAEKAIDLLWSYQPDP